MGQRTALYEQHVESGAKMVDFSGWDMPIHYGSQIDEHHHVRQDAGMFDVSHMTIVHIKGSGAKDFLRKLFANDVAKLKGPGRAMYSCMLDENGGVIDDLISYYLSDTHYCVVVNCATHDKDLAWIKQQAQQYDVEISEDTASAILAIQGPQAIEKVLPLLADDKRAVASELKAFQCAAVADWLIAHTGYTGEDGFELVLPPEQAMILWQQLVQAGVAPCGLGARDTLRLEAGMNLYGQDMTEEVTPLEAGLAWTVAWEPEDRDFMGRTALEKQREAGVTTRFAGLVLEGRGVLRAHQKVVVEDFGEGETTSGGFSPTLSGSIAFARLPKGKYDKAMVEIRGKMLPVRVIKLPFVRQGKKVFE